MQFHRKCNINTHAPYNGLGVLKKAIKLHPMQKSGAVVLLKMLCLSLKPKSLHIFKATCACFKIEYGSNPGNAKSLWAFTNLSFA